MSLTTSGSAIAKAGSDAPPIATATMNVWINEAEASLGVQTRKDWVGASIGSSALSGSLSAVVSSMVAMNIISSDIPRYTSRATAQTLLDVNNNIITQLIPRLKEDNVKELF